MRRLSQRRSRQRTQRTQNARHCEPNMGALRARALCRASRAKHRPCGSRAALAIRATATRRIACNTHTRTANHCAAYPTECRSPRTQQRSTTKAPADQGARCELAATPAKAARYMYARPSVRMTAHATSTNARHARRPMRDMLCVRAARRSGAIRTCDLAKQHTSRAACTETEAATERRPSLPAPPATRHDIGVVAAHAARHAPTQRRSPSIRQRARHTARHCCPNTGTTFLRLSNACPTPRSTRAKHRPPL